MSVSTYLKTIWLSTLLLIGSAFASGMSESEKASSSSSSAARTPASVAGVPVPGFCEIAFKRSAHGITFSCPSLQPDELTTKKMMQILEAFKKDTLNEDLPAIKTLIKDKKMACEVSECGCSRFIRSNGRRALFEERIVSSYEGINIDKKKPFRYVSYGSGLLFQDLVIAMKLIAAGFTDLTLVLVDNYYQDFFALLANDQVSLTPMRGSSEAVKINNALYYLVTFFSYLKHMHKNFNLTIKVYDNPEKVAQDLPSQSCDLIYAIDLNFPLYLSQEEIDRNPLTRGWQQPKFDSPYLLHPLTKQYITQEYFKLADAVLKDKRFNHVCTNLKYISYRTNILIEEAKLVQAVHFSLDKNLRAYLYHKEDTKGFELVIGNHYRFYINARTQQIVIDDLYTHTPMNVQDNGYLRALLTTGQPLAVEHLNDLKGVIAELDANHRQRQVMWRLRMEQ